jgi:hypothetical protein
MIPFRKAYFGSGTFVESFLKYNIPPVQAFSFFFSFRFSI